jgi:hypothetical protein
MKDFYECEMENQRIEDRVMRWVICVGIIVTTTLLGVSIYITDNPVSKPICCPCK